MIQCLSLYSARKQTFQHDAAFKANVVRQNAFHLFEVNIAFQNLKDGLLKSGSYCC